MMDSKPSSPLVHQWVVIIIISMLIFGTAAVAARADTSDTWSLRDTVREIEPAVVWIIAKIDTNEWSQGTGFIIHEDGYIITNAHVVEDASDILVGWPNRFDRDEQLATVIATDPDLDLALLSIPGSHFPVIPFDPLASPMCGDAVVTLGFPAGDDLGLGNLSVTRGIISSIRVESERTNRTIQTDAAVTLGCSGGPLFDLDTGTVVGIVQGKGMFLLEGFNFAVPIDYIFEFSQTPPELGTEAAIASLGGFHDENFSAPWDRSLESYNQGLIARGQASWGEALSHFLMATTLDDEDPLAAYNAAESYAALQHPSLALHWLERAFELGYSDFEGALESPGFSGFKDDERFVELVESF